MQCFYLCYVKFRCVNITCTTAVYTRCVIVVEKDGQNIELIVSNYRLLNAAQMQKNRKYQ